MSTKIYRTISRLDASIRWCLTGTPIQNSLEDIGSLVSFLRIPQLGNDSPTNFKKHIIDPLMKCEGMGSETLRLLLDSICLRRSKNLLDLPDMNDEYRVLDFSEAERLQYNAAEKAMSQAIKSQVYLENNRKGYFGIFQLEMQLRRLCNHGTFQKRNPDAIAYELGTGQADSTAKFEVRNSFQCDYCHQSTSGNVLVDQLFNGHFTVCGHLLCSGCLPLFDQQLTTSRKSSDLQCPLCHKSLHGDYLLGEDQTGKADEEMLSSVGESFKESGVSSKVNGLLHDIGKISPPEKRYVIHSDTCPDLSSLRISVKHNLLRLDKVS